jgi:DNA repair exonuclease SbcCD nuclease subunit
MQDLFSGVKTRKRQAPKKVVKPKAIEVKVPAGVDLKILHLADLHITDDRRLQDQMVVLDFIKDNAAKTKPDLILIAGDLTNHQPRKALPSERNILVKFLQELSAHAPVHVARGNHDAPDDWTFIDELETGGHPISYHERACMVQDIIGTQHVDLYFIPHPDRAWLAAQAGGKLEATNEGIRAGMMSVLNGMRQRGRPDALRVGVAHMNIRGARMDNDQPGIGYEVELSEQDIDELGLHLACLGHIHKPQVLADGRAIFAGSPTFGKFGCTGERGFYVHHFNGGKLKSEFIETPCRRFVTLQMEVRQTDDGLQWFEAGEAVDWPDGDGTRAGGQPVQDCEVKVKLVYPDHVATAIDQQDIERRLLGMGAHSAKVEGKPLVVEKVRAPEIADKKKLSDKLLVYVQEQGTELTPQVQAAVLERLALLEDKSQNDVLAWVREQ